MLPVATMSRPGASLQRLHLVDDWAMEHGGVRPPRVVQCARDDVLVDCVEVVGHTCRVVRLVRPESVEDLERVAAHEQRVGGLPVLGTRRRDVGLTTSLRIEPRFPGRSVQGTARSPDFIAAGRSARIPCDAEPLRGCCSFLG